jgi:hypothetical protein
VAFIIFYSEIQYAGFCSKQYISVHIAAPEAETLEQVLHPSNHTLHDDETVLVAEEQESSSPQFVFGLKLFPGLYWHPAGGAA